MPSPARFPVTQQPVPCCLPAGIPVQLSGLDHLAGAATGVMSWLMAHWPARPEFGLSLLTSQNPITSGPGGGWPVLSVGLFSPPLPPLIDPYPENWTLPGSTAVLWGKSHPYHWGTQDSQAPLNWNLPRVQVFPL
jgi:hypothetical protein